MKFKRILPLTYSFLFLILIEFLLKIFTSGVTNSKFLYILIFALPVSGMIYFFTALFPALVNKILFNVIIFIFSVYFSVQSVYYSIFGGYLSVSQFRMGGDAFNNFADQVKIGINNSILSIAVFLLFTLASVLLSAFGVFNFERIKIKYTLIGFVSTGLLYLLVVLSLGLGGKGAYTLYDIYHSKNTSTDNSVQNLGVTVTTGLEIKQLLIGNFESVASGSDFDPITDITIYPYSDYNVTNIDFNDILAECKSIDEAELTDYFAHREPTEKNQYTGLFKGYNLITVCAEAFSPYAIDKELTPTLYMLANEGFVFENFYASYESVTTNGEYTYCLGMFPDISRDKSNNSFIVSADNALPYALGNQFKSISANTFAYHNFLSTFYSRNLTHPNMGYDVFKTPDNGLDIAPTWPSSDYDMMVQSVDDYIESGDQFHAYYMTFSGHHQYDWTNVMCARNKSLVNHLDYPIPVKAYLASNMELEKALTYLIDRLEKAGVLDKTVIALTTDHYPYGLEDQYYNILAGKEVEQNFEKYKNSFLCWSSSMEEPVYINKLCSTIDILPTLLNLFGFEYDSRLIMGRDILSSSEGIAVLANENFITEDYKFNAGNNRLIVGDGVTIDQEKVEGYKSYIKEIFDISKKILNTDYYKFIEGD